MSVSKMTKEMTTKLSIQLNRAISSKENFNTFVAQVKDKVALEQSHKSEMRRILMDTIHLIPNSELGSTEWHLGFDLHGELHDIMRTLR